MPSITVSSDPLLHVVVGLTYGPVELQLFHCHDEYVVTANGHRLRPGKEVKTYAQAECWFNWLRDAYLAAAQG